MQKEFPPVKELFTQTWIIFKRSIVPLLLLNIAVIVAYTLLFVLIGVVAVLFGAGSLLPMLSGKSFEALSLLKNTGIIISIVFGGTFLFLGSFIIGSVFEIGAVLIVANAKPNASLSDSIRNSLGFIVPVFIVRLVSGLLTTGAMMLLFIPGLLVYFLFIFATYEVILGGKRGMEALKRSVYIVTSNFGALLGRVLLYFLIYITIMFVIPGILGSPGKSVSAMVNILSFFVNILLGWYTIAYSFTLYKQASERSDREKQSSILWIGILALIGWIVLFLFGWVGVNAMKSFMGKSTIQDFVNQIQSTKEFQQKNVDVNLDNLQNLDVEP